MATLPLLPGGGIDFQKVLADDPQLQQALQTITDQQQAEYGIRAANVQQALIQGGFPGFNLGPAAGPWGGRVDPQSGNLVGTVPFEIGPDTQRLIDLANQAGTSTYAQLQHQNAVQNASTLNQLAARNFLRSGALGAHESENTLAQNIADFNARMTLQNQAAGFYQTYLGQAAADRSARADVINQALQRIIAGIQAGLYPIPGPGSGDPGTTIGTGAPNPFQTARVDPTKDQPTTNINEGGQLVPEPKGLPPALNNPANNPFGAGGVLADEAAQAAA